MEREGRVLLSLPPRWACYKPIGEQCSPQTADVHMSGGFLVNTAGRSGKAIPSPQVAPAGAGPGRGGLGNLALGARGSFAKIKSGGTARGPPGRSPGLSCEFSPLGPIPECPATPVFGQKLSVQNFITCPDPVPV